MIGAVLTLGFAVVFFIARTVRRIEAAQAESEPAGA
jgi:hypothetical protein